MAKIKQDKKESDKRGLIASLIAIIVLLSLTCTVSIVYNFIGGFYYSRMVSFNSILGEDQTIVINDEGAYACSMNFAGTLVWGSDIKQQVFLQNQEENLYVRARMLLDGKEMLGVLFGFVNWIQAEDGYIYYNQVLPKQDKVGLCKYVKINDDLKFETNMNYILTIVVETSLTPYEYVAI